jgi:hypothetical protein
MMQANRVVDGLAESLEDGDFARRVDGGTENDLLEQIDGEMLGTGEGKKQAARPQVPQRVEIEKLVSASGSVNVTTPASQRGRVEHDNVKSGVTFLEISKNVAFE